MALKMERIGVLYLIDSLDAGGAERVAVNLANNLPRDQFRAYLCATRRSGPLEKDLDPEVGFLKLNRHSRFDFGALIRLIKYIRQNQIQIIHAHSSSLFLGWVAACCCNCLLLWHIHSSIMPESKAILLLYKVICRKVDMVFTVTHPVADWVLKEINLPQNRIMYLPNFVVKTSNLEHKLLLPGSSGYRVLCVANLRAIKDQLGLLKAFSFVSNMDYRAHLILVGAMVEPEYGNLVLDEIKTQRLEKKVTWLGGRNDVYEIMAACDIAVISSISEGFPLTLLEYGWAGLPVIATRVGECAEILDYGKAGILVEPGNPKAMAEQILNLLANHALRRSYGDALRERVQKEYSSEIIMKKITDVYRQVLTGDREN